MVDAVGGIVGNEPLRPWQGDPWLLRGAGVVYDTVGSPSSVEQALRVADRRSSIVVTGVEAPRRFEWTPLYFKEVSIIGSNAFGVETFEGRRMHSMEIYFDLLARGLELTPVITHRYPLSSYRDAFLTLHAKGKNNAVKAMFTFNDDGV
jgi:threonine dehydrogenase-like Zn-dependent dehydrogenase